MYLCKVFTPEFKVKFDAQVEQEVIAKLTKKGDINHERASFLKEFERLRVKDSFYFMWNKPEELNKYPEIEEYYKSIGLWTPEYTEIQLESAEKGLQSRARVMWNGEIKKIDEIDEIFSYKHID